MTKKILWALIMIVLSVIVLIINHDGVEVKLLFTTVDASKSFVFLGFIGVGVAIGFLLK